MAFVYYGRVQLHGVARGSTLMCMRRRCSHVSYT